MCARKSSLTSVRELDAKERKLRAILRSLDSVVVGFSGGVDSTYLSAMARAVLRSRHLAVTVDTPFQTREEIRELREVAAALKLRHRVLPADPLAVPEITANPPDRCYRCKQVVFGLLAELARAEGFAAVVDGGNTDDASDYRPGRRALAELGVRSPLAEAGFNKEDIREASRRLKLPTAEKPANACLATRIPFGTPLTPATLEAVGRAEHALAELGFSRVRVRAHGEVARLELPPDELARAAAPRLRARLVAAVRASGFSYVALDLEGYRMGSLNETLKGRAPARS